MFKIDMSDVTRTYNGRTGCACGCGGSYAAPGSGATKKRVDFINKNLRRAVVASWTGESCFEVENTDGTRVTRVYVATSN